MSDKLHGLTVFVQPRVTTELRLDRNRPRQALWSWSLFGAEICELQLRLPGSNGVEQTSRNVVPRVDSVWGCAATSGR